jgi:YebC/PmpR family DNA-binding regulatory protein
MSPSDETSRPETEREKQFETMRRAIVVAAREQGADPETNLRLRLALQRADNSKMPDDRVERAHREGRGELDAPDYKELTYEGYGPYNVAVFVESITDDKKRTQEELEELFDAHGGSLGEDGCVAWQFDRRGLVQVVADDVDDEDDFMLEVIEMGADDFREPLYDRPEGDRVPVYRVYTDYEDLWDVARQLDEAGYGIHAAAPTLEATQKVGLDSGEAREFMQFYEKVLKHEDVQNVYANWESN